MSACVDACLRHRVVLPLEWAGGVNDDVRPEPSQLRGETRCATLE